MHQKEEREGGRWREGERKKEGRRLRHGPWSQFTLLQKSGSKSSMQGSMQSLMHPSVRPWRLSHEWDSSHVCLAFLHPHMLPQVSIRGLKSIYFPSFRVATSLKLNIQKTKIMASSPITSWQIDGETMETVTDFILGSSKITADGDCSHEIKTLAPWKKSYDQPRQHIKKQRHYFADKGPSSQGYCFSSSHVWM